MMDPCFGGRSELGRLTAYRRLEFLQIGPGRQQGQAPVGVLGGPNMNLFMTSSFKFAVRRNSVSPCLSSKLSERFSDV